MPNNSISGRRFAPPLMLSVIDQQFQYIAFQINFSDNTQ